MRLDSSVARLTPLMSNDLLTRITAMRLRAVRRFTNRHHGEHLSGKGGSSIEFADYRDYVPGDDVRFVDWNIFSRLHRPYLKLYHEEQVMHVLLLVDASRSMLFEDKLLRAQQLAGAFAVMSLFGTERVGIYAFNAAPDCTARMDPVSGRGKMADVLRFIEDIAGGGQGRVEDGIAEALRRHVGRGIAIVLSDFLTFGDLHGTFNRLHSAGLEPHAVQVLGPTELAPELDGDVRLVDSETGQVVDVSSAGRLLDVYHDCLDGMERDLESLARSRSGRYIRVSSGDALDQVVCDQLRRGGWVS